MVGNREGFDLLPHIHSDAIAQEKRLISCVDINAKMKIRQNIPKETELRPGSIPWICLGLPR